MRKEILTLVVILTPLSVSAQRVAFEQLASLAPIGSAPVSIAGKDRSPTQVTADKGGEDKAHPCSAHKKFDDLPFNEKEGPLTVAEVREIVRRSCVAFGRCEASADFQTVSASTIGELGLVRGKMDNTLLKNTLTHNIERHDHYHANPKVKLAAFMIEESMTLEKLASVLTSAQRPL